MPEAGGAGRCISGIHYVHEYLTDYGTWEYSVLYKDILQICPRLFARLDPPASVSAGQTSYRACKKSSKVCTDKYFPSHQRCQM